MPRTKIGNQGGFLDDRQFVDGIKITFFIGAFFTALTWLNEGNQMEMGKRMMRALFWVMSMPTVGSPGVKGEIMDSIMFNEAEKERIKNAPHTARVRVEEALTRPTKEAIHEIRLDDPDPQKRTIGEGIRQIPSRAKRKTRGALRKAFSWTRRK